MKAGDGCIQRVGEGNFRAIFAEPRGQIPLLRIFDNSKSSCGQAV